MSESIGRTPPVSPSAEVPRVEGSDRANPRRERRRREERPAPAPPPPAETPDGDEPDESEAPDKGGRLDVRV